MSELTQSDLLKVLDYQPETGSFVWKVSYGPANKGDIAGRENNDGYIQIGVSGKRYQAHRLAWLYFYGRWPTGQIDHVNRSRSDNRILNLRECNQSENMQNRVTTTNVSGVLGVVWNKKSKKWRAQITAYGKHYYLGVFSSIDDAQAARIAAQKQLHPFNPSMLEPTPKAPSVNADVCSSNPESTSLSPAFAATVESKNGSARKSSISTEKDFVLPSNLASALSSASNSFTQSVYEFNVRVERFGRATTKACKTLEQVPA
jgi:hypothetical protein